MASYFELLDMIATTESVKSAVGKVGLSAIDKAKELKEKAPEIKNKIDEKYKKATSNETYGKALKNVANTAKKVAGVAVTPTIVSSNAMANGITKLKESNIKKKYSGNPEKLEEELKKNINKLDDLKSDIMAIQVWTLGMPLAAVSCGTLDSIVKGIMAAGAIAKDDKNLANGVAKSLLWIPLLASKLSKVTGKEITGDKAKDIIKEATTKITSTLSSWAKSDAHLVKESTMENCNDSDDLVKTICLICESYINDEITLDEVALLMGTITLE